VQSKYATEQERLKIDAYAAMQQPLQQSVNPNPVDVTPKEERPINITIDGSRPRMKTSKATRQPDGSYIMETLETPVEGAM